MNELMKKIQYLKFSEVIEILNITQAEINKKLKISIIHFTKVGRKYCKWTDQVEERILGLKDEVYYARK